MSCVRRLDADWLRTGALASLLELLDCDGEEARVVGGAVRNALLAEPVAEIDIATTAIPQEVIRRAEDAGFKAVPTGIEHGTVTVVIESRPYEVTTLREDVETDGRHATVRFGRDWRRDAERRDFTMNALSATRDGMVHDYVGGLADLEAGRVRFIGEPRARIAEDYLRILRFFRFHAAYGRGVLDPASLAACIAERDGLARLSRERIRMELFKLLPGRHAVPVVTVTAECGIIETVLGGVPQLASFGNMTKLEAALALSPDPVRRLGALALYLPEDADRLRERLRLANAEYERLAAMADGWWHVSAALGENARRGLLYRLGPDTFVDRVLLAWARSQAGVAAADWRELTQLPEHWSAPAFPIKAADLLARGMSRGPALGAALRAAEDAWIAAGLPLDPERIAALADDVARADRGTRA